MKYRKISLSEDAFVAALTLMDLGGKYDLPKGFGQGNDEMQKFLLGRDELCQKGFAELDFDGSINPARDFMRTIYALPRATSYMRFEDEWFLRGPIELLHIYKEDGSYVLAQCSTDELVEWIKNNLYKRTSGSLVTVAKGKRREADLLCTEPGQDERANILAEHLCMFYEKEAPDA